jgi:hypothetical protein
VSERENSFAVKELLRQTEGDTARNPGLTSGLADDDLQAGVARLACAAALSLFFKKKTDSKPFPKISSDLLSPVKFLLGPFSHLVYF